jgi:hypothetical protein
MEETRQYIYTSTLPLSVAPSGLNVDRKWATIFLFYIAPAGSWTQDLLALIPCRTACSSQCDQKTDLMEETRQYIYTSTAYHPSRRYHRNSYPEEDHQAGSFRSKQLQRHIRKVGHLIKRPNRGFVEDKWGHAVTLWYTAINRILPTTTPEREGSHQTHHWPHLPCYTRTSTATPWTRHALKEGQEINLTCNTVKS